MFTHQCNKLHTHDLLAIKVKVSSFYIIIVSDFVTHACSLSLLTVRRDRNKVKEREQES